MNNLLFHYQNLPSYLDPTFFSIGSFAISWYSLAYIGGFLMVFWLLKWRIKKKEIEITNQKATDFLWDLLLFVFLGLILGARIGYVFFYNLSFYLENPLSIFSPFDFSTGEFVGIYGMSFHGGFLGALLFGFIFSKIKKIDFWKLTNFVLPAVPAGYFLGRLGNFFNGELYGRATEKFWGMYFPTDNLGILRHPSQLYEAFWEGLVLFLILWLMRNKLQKKGSLLALYAFFYAVFRIGVEFLREPDEQIGLFWGIFSLGQILSAGMLLAVLIFVRWSKRKKSAII